MWIERVVAFLAARKREGDSFDVAWAAALRAYPPRSRDWGEPAASLFDPPTEGLVEFSERVCRDSWYGRNPRLRYFGADVVVELPDRDASRAPLPA